MSTLGTRLAKARAEAGLNQKALAKIVNVSQQAISKIEREKAKATYLLVPLAKALNVNVDWLSAGTGPMRPGTGDIELDALAIEDPAAFVAATELFERLTALPDRQQKLIAGLISEMRE